MALEFSLVTQIKPASASGAVCEVNATVGFGGIDCLSCDKFGTISSALTNSNCNVSTPSWQAINGTGFGWYVRGGLSLKEHCGGGDILTVFSTSILWYSVH